ncbi:MAG: endonuclease/exonuclease/phosphatase family protein, partial [Solirubrobacterales bacterium]
TQWADEYGKFPPADGPGPPWVLAGDFNATLDHKRFRDVIDTGYRDVADVMGQGIVSTWPSDFTWPLPVTIDHVLTEDPVAIIGYDVEAVAGSDHRAIFADLVIPGQ